MVALVAVMGAGIVSGAAEVACLFAACLCVALMVVLSPPRLRAKVGPFAAAFVAAAGVLPVFLSSGTGQDADSTRPPTNVQEAYLAELVSRGPFTEALPSPLRARTLSPIGVGDPSASARLSAVELVIDVDPESGAAPDSLNAFALIEIYPTHAAAAKRKTARVDGFIENYGQRNVYGACVDDYGAHGAGWTCVQARGNAYAEAAISPSSNSNTPLATGTLSALLSYTDRLTKVAS